MLFYMLLTGVLLERSFLSNICDSKFISTAAILPPLFFHLVCTKNIPSAMIQSDCKSDKKEGFVYGSVFMDGYSVGADCS